MGLGAGRFWRLGWMFSEIEVWRRGGLAGWLPFFVSRDVT